MKRADKYLEERHSQEVFLKERVSVQETRHSVKVVSLLIGEDSARSESLW